MRKLFCLVAVGLCGCALMPTQHSLREAGMWPSRTEPFCVPHGRYKAERKQWLAGVRGRW